jgi:hypothetical protein
MGGIRTIILISFVIAALSSPCLADNFYYLILAGDASGPCVSAEYGNITVIGVFEFDTPTKGVRFSAPLPVYNATLLTENVSFSYTGDLSTGVIVDFDSCRTGAVGMFYREFSINGQTCLGGIEGYSGAGTLPIVIECNDFEHQLTDQACGGAQPPYNLAPPNGAAGVELTPTLSWSWDQPGVCREGIGLLMFSVYLGTDPDDLPLVYWTDTFRQATVGPLLPNTQYYWYVYVYDDFWEYPGPHSAQSGIHAFTTEAPINAEETTWGRVKNLFR